MGFPGLHHNGVRAFGYLLRATDGCTRGRETGKSGSLGGYISSLFRDFAIMQSGWIGGLWLLRGVGCRPLPAGPRVCAASGGPQERGGFLDITLRLNRTVCGYCSRHNTGSFFTIDRSSQYSFLLPLFCSFFNRRVMTATCYVVLTGFHASSRIPGFSDHRPSPSAGRNNDRRRSSKNT